VHTTAEGPRVTLPPFSHSPGTVFETPSPTPHLLHLQQSRQHTHTAVNTHWRGELASTGVGGLEGLEGEVGGVGREGSGANRRVAHLPNFQWCAPPLGQVPDSDSIAEPAGCFMVDASPGMRLGGAPPSGERHLGHSGLPCASSPAER